MNKELLEWILNKMDEACLQNICKEMKIKIPGFRNFEKYPKLLIISNLMKNKNDLFNYFKKMPDVLEEEKEFNGKDIIEIESLIDIKNKRKNIIHIIYLITRDKLEYTNLASKIINKEGKNIQTDNLIKYEKKEDNMIENIKNIDKYIVNIKVENDYYYNIYPLLKFKDNKLMEVEKDDYPDYGNINVNPYLEFSKQKYDITSSLWICIFNQNQLEEIENKTKFNGESKTKFKINGDELIKNKSIYSINEEGIYEIVELLEDNVNLEKLIYKNKIEIKNKPNSQKIYIKDNNYIYGPFDYEDNTLGGGYYLDKEKNDYIIQKYPIGENQSNLSIIEIYNPYVYNNSYIKVVYFYNKENLISETIDAISNEELLNKLKETINTKNTNYSRREIQEIRKNINAIADNFLSEERMNRIKKLIKNTKITDTVIENDLLEIIESLLENEESQNKIADKILEKPENLRKLQNVEKVQFSIDKLNEDLNNKRKELKQIQLAINESNDKNKEQLIAESQTDLKKMTNNKEKLQKDVKELEEKYEKYKTIDDLNEEIKELRNKTNQAENDYYTFRRRNEENEENVKKIENNVRNKLENIIKQYSDIPFDGMIANEMLESAAKWNKRKNIESFQQSIASKENVSKCIKVKEFKDEEVIDYIYDNIKKSRDYSRNDIINIMICLTQEFLTVFAGEPGVGKTSICNIIAKTLGLSNKDINYNRFIEISVEKGWTSKRDLIGYYNPLTKSFDKNNKSLFKAFNILHQEYSKVINDFPYYILLDEANLSSMEHYWADFMNVCDLDKEDRKINLGEDYIYDIPQTLRFLATINYDHTTETLSPRLVDRAWIILLEKGSLEIDDYSYCDLEQQISDGIIMFEDLKKYFSYSSYGNLDEEGANSMYDELKKIYEIFEKNNVFISKRIDNTIKRYLRVGCNLLEDTKDTMHEFVALDYVVAQKLLPKINGFGDQYKNFLENLYEEFNSKNLMKCKSIVTDILNKGNNNMQYYQFFS